MKLHWPYSLILEAADARKRAEYRTVKTEKLLRFFGGFFGKISESIFSENSNFQFFWETFFFRKSLFFQKFSFFQKITFFSPFSQARVQEQRVIRERAEAQLVAEAEAEKEMQAEADAEADRNFQAEETEELARIADAEARAIVQAAEAVNNNVMNDNVENSDAEDEDSSAEEEWMVAGTFKQRFVQKRTKVVESAEFKVLTVAFLHDKSKLKWAFLVNLLKSAMIKLGIEGAIVGTHDNHLEGQRTVVKNVEIRINSQQDCTVFLALLRGAVPTLNLGLPEDVLKTANAANYAWTGLRALLGSEYGKPELQNLLNQCEPNRFLVGDFSIETTTDELTNLTISKDGAQAKIFDNRSGELDGVDEFIICKRMMIHGIDVDATCKGLNLYRTCKIYFEIFAGINFFGNFEAYLRFFNGLLRLLRNARRALETFSRRPWELRTGNDVVTAVFAVTSCESVQRLVLRYNWSKMLNGLKGQKRRCPSILNEFMFTSYIEKLFSMSSAEFKYANKYLRQVNSYVFIVVFIPTSFPTINLVSFVHIQ